MHTSTPRTRRPLTAAFVRSVTHSGRRSASGGRTVEKYHDATGAGAGLILHVTPAGAKQWVQRLSMDGVRRDYGLGGYPDLSLADARLAAQQNAKAAREYRRAVHRGEPARVPGFEIGRRNTLAQRPKLAARTPEPRRPRRVRGLLTFGNAWEACIVERSRGWKDAPTSLRSWRADLKHHLQALEHRPVAAVTVDDLRDVFGAMKERTADKVLRRAATVFDWSCAGSQRPDNPATALRKTWRGLASNGTRGHHKALPFAAAPGCYARLAALDTPAAAALRLVFLTALRSGEARGARWEEIDLDARIWTVPAARMKDGKAHRVPLSDAACALLRAAGPEPAGQVFVNGGGRPVTDKALLKVLQVDLGADATVHGLRSTFRDWAGEGGIAREVAETCLAHSAYGSVEAAYARGDLLDHRRAAMDRWAVFLEGAA